MKQPLSDRQREIIEMSGKILLNKGVKGLTTKILAREMGFTESAIYRHFKTKEDIILHLLHILHQDMENRLGLVINQQLSASQKIQQIFHSQFQFFQEHPHFSIAILSEGLFDESKKIHQAVLKIVGFKSGLLTHIVEEGRHANEFSKTVDTDDVVHILMGAFRLQLIKWKFSKFSLDLETEGNKKISTIIHLIKQ